MSENDLTAGQSIVLEDFSFTPDVTQADSIRAIAKWLAEKAMPQTDEYKYWRECLPRRLCILPNEAFRDFVLYATEIQPHIKLNRKPRP